MKGGKKPHRKCEKLHAYKMKVDFWHRVPNSRQNKKYFLYKIHSTREVFMWNREIGMAEKKKFCHYASAFNGRKRCESIINVIHIPRMQLVGYSCVCVWKSALCAQCAHEMCMVSGINAHIHELTNSMSFVRNGDSNNEWKYDKWTSIRLCGGTFYMPNVEEGKRTNILIAHIRPKNSAHTSEFPI